MKKLLGMLVAARQDNRCGWMAIHYLFEGFSHFPIAPVLEVVPGIETLGTWNGIDQGREHRYRQEIRPRRAFQIPYVPKREDMLLPGNEAAVNAVADQRVMQGNDDDPPAPICYHGRQFVIEVYHRIRLARGICSTAGV